MARVHDRGGWPAAGPIDRREHELAWWEKKTDALLMLLVSRDKQIMRVDELRRGIESIEPGAYEKLRYYERWITSIEAILVEKGIVTREEIDRKLEALREGRRGERRQ